MEMELTQHTDITQTKLDFFSDVCCFVRISDYGKLPLFLLSSYLFWCRCSPKNYIATTINNTLILLSELTKKEKVIAALNSSFFMVTTRRKI